MQPGKTGFLKRVAILALFACALMFSHYLTFLAGTRVAATRNSSSTVAVNGVIDARARAFSTKFYDLVVIAGETYIVKMSDQTPVVGILSSQFKPRGDYLFGSMMSDEEVQLIYPQSAPFPNWVAKPTSSKEGVEFTSIKGNRIAVKLK